MASERPSDPLSMDITADLERVDGVVTQILKDRGVWDEFLRDPNGVFVRLGLHPPTSPEVNERANRAFYATLTNRRLIELLVEHYREFRIADESRRQIIENLRRGGIENPLEVDLAALEHLLSHTHTLREALRLTLHDLNDKGILEGRYRPEALDEYIDGVMEAIGQRRAVVDHPTLETWDRQYGIGLRFGGLLVEVSGLVTATAVAEAGAVATAVAFVVAEVEVVVDSGPIVAIYENAPQGDEDSVRAVTILGRLLDLSGELLTHAHRFEIDRKQ